MPAINFRITATDGPARVGRLRTPHGTIDTPAFVPVGTQASVKTLDSSDLRDLGVDVVLANTYHLYLRPGAALVAKLGGLHQFMAWDGPIITDSGGFQVFSLGFGLEHGVSKISNIFPDEDDDRQHVSKPKLMRVDSRGVSFASHLDGSRHRLTAEKSVKIQQQLGADIILAFDECTSPLHDEAYTDQALARTHRWAERSLAAWTNRRAQALFGIVQGGAYQSRREQSARFIDDLPFPGIAIGGSLGRTKADMHRIIEWVTPLVDPAKPRHLLGIGEITDLFEGVRRGIDLFDCVAPTRQARNGGAYISPKSGGKPSNGFRINLRGAKYRRDSGPIDTACDCTACRRYSRAYLRHLFVSHELSAMRLTTIHNLRFVTNLMSGMRQAVARRRFQQLAKAWLGN